MRHLAISGPWNFKIWNLGIKISNFTKFELWELMGLRVWISLPWHKNLLNLMGQNRHCAPSKLTVSHPLSNSLDRNLGITKKLYYVFETIYESITGFISVYSIFHGCLSFTSYFIKVLTLLSCIYKLNFQKSKKHIFQSQK